MKRKYYQFSDFAYLMKCLVHYLHFDHAIAFLYAVNWFLLYDHHVLQNKMNFSGNEDQKLKVINPYDLLSAKYYKTEIQFFRALEELRGLLTGLSLDKREERFVMLIGDTMEEIQNSFASKYQMPINDPRTVYALCNKSLVPSETEPQECLYENHMQSLLQQYSKDFYGDCTEDDDEGTDVDTMADAMPCTCCCCNGCQHHVSTTNNQ